jgi:hypothetical protein
MIKATKRFIFRSPTFHDASSWKELFQDSFKRIKLDFFFLNSLQNFGGKVSNSALKSQ